MLLTSKNNCHKVFFKFNGVNKNSVNYWPSAIYFADVPVGRRCMTGRSAIRSIRKITEFVIGGTTVALVTTHYQSHMARQHQPRLRPADAAHLAEQRRQLAQKDAEDLAIAREEGRQQGLKEVSEKKSSGVHLGSPEDIFNVE